MVISTGAVKAGVETGGGVPAGTARDGVEDSTELARGTGVERGFGPSSSSSSSFFSLFFADGVGEAFAPFFFRFFFAVFGLPLGVFSAFGSPTVRISSRAFKKASRFFLSASLISARRKDPSAKNPSPHSRKFLQAGCAAANASACRRAADFSRSRRRTALSLPPNKSKRQVRYIQVRRTKADARAT